MYTIRLILAVCVFCLGFYLLFDLFFSGFSLIILFSSILCFVAAHYIKPKEQEGGDSSSLYDIIDLILEIPFRAIAFSLRSIGRLFKGDTNGVDGIDYSSHKNESVV